MIILGTHLLWCSHVDVAVGLELPSHDLDGYAGGIIATDRVSHAGQADNEEERD